MKGWKSIAFFAVTGLAYLIAWPGLTNLLDPKWIAVGSSVIGILLRLVTTTPVGKPE